MKTLLQISKLALLLVLAASTPPSASAFYDSTLGRWIKRDPISEKTFNLTLDWYPQSTIEEDTHIYAFVRNAPLDAFDPFGLKRNRCCDVNWGCCKISWTSTSPPMVQEETPVRRCKMEATYDFSSGTCCPTLSSTKRYIVYLQGSCPRNPPGPGFGEAYPITTCRLTANGDYDKTYVP